MLLFVQRICCFRYRASPCSHYFWYWLLGSPLWLACFNNYYNIAHSIDSVVCFVGGQPALAFRAVHSPRSRSLSYELTDFKYASCKFASNSPTWTRSCGTGVQDAGGDLLLATGLLLSNQDQIGRLDVVAFTHRNLQGLRS